MLWLAGLMGLFAVGSVTVVEMESIFGAGSDESNADLEADKNEQDAAEPTGASSDLADIETQTSTPNTEPDGVEIQVTDGDEFHFGTDNADTMTGGAGNDTLHGQGDDDLIQGDAGNDTLFGHNGDDTLHGGGGADSLQGSDGNDAAEGGASNDAVHGGLGDDTLSGRHGDDVVRGITNGVNIDMEDDGDFLNGGDGDDVIIAGNDDIVTPGNGTDTIVDGSWVTDSRAIDIIDFDSADDNILLIYEDDTEAPDISLQPDPYDLDVTQVLMDGVAVANIANGAEISIEDISLMPLSLAQSTGLAPL